jgi:hypothetical protein
MKTGGHLGRCYARVRRSVSVRIFPISVFGQLPPVCSRLRPVRGWLRKFIREWVDNARHDLADKLEAIVDEAAGEAMEPMYRNRH